MGSTNKTTTQTSTIPGASGQEIQARNNLSQLGGSIDQLGNLGDLANGNMQLDPRDLQRLLQIQALTGQAGRQQLQQNFDAASGAVEGNLLDRGIAGSSIEAVNKALLGRQLQQSLDQSSIQGQIQTAEGARKEVFDKAGVKLNANQALLQRILGGSGQAAQLGLQERLAQGTTTQETKTPFDLGGALKGVARGAAAYMSGGTSELAIRGAKVLNAAAGQGAN